MVSMKHNWKTSHKEKQKISATLSWNVARPLTIRHYHFTFSSVAVKAATEELSITSLGKRFQSRMVRGKKVHVSASFAKNFANIFLVERTSGTLCKRFQVRAFVDSKVIMVYHVECL